MDSQRVKQAAAIVGAGMAAYALYRVIAKDDKPAVAVKKAIEAPVTVVEKAAEAVGQVAKETTNVAADTAEAVAKAPRKVAGAALNAPKKGSESAKAWAAKMKAARERKRAAKPITPDQKPSDTFDMVKGLRTEKEK